MNVKSLILRTALISSLICFSQAHAGQAEIDKIEQASANLDVQSLKNLSRRSKIFGALSRRRKVFGVLDNAAGNPLASKKKTTRQSAPQDRMPARASSIHQNHSRFAAA